MVGSRDVYGDVLVPVETAWQPSANACNQYLASWSDLPDGAFVLLDAPSVVVGSHLAEWTTQGYQARHRRPTRGAANVITPPSTIAALRAGYPAQIDDAAR